MKDFRVTERVELKVCEACGSLWVRAAQQGVYCASCAHWLKDFPAPRGRSRRGRRKAARPAITAPPFGGVALPVSGGAR